MEKESASIPLTDSEFIALLHLAKQGDQEAILTLIHYFEQDISRLTRYIRLPREDAEQSLIAEMIDLFKNKEL